MKPNKPSSSEIEALAFRMFSESLPKWSKLVNYKRRRTVDQEWSVLSDNGKKSWLCVAGWVLANATLKLARGKGAS